MIRYRKLFALLTMRGMKKTDLLEIISSKTLAKLSKGENINTDVINKICLFLECQPSDIMEVVEIVEPLDDYHTLITKKTSPEEYNGIIIQDEIAEQCLLDEPHKSDEEELTLHTKLSTEVL